MSGAELPGAGKGDLFLRAEIETGGADRGGGIPFDGDIGPCGPCEAPPILLPFCIGCPLLCIG